MIFLSFKIAPAYDNMQEGIKPHLETLPAQNVRKVRKRYANSGTTIPAQRYIK